MVVRFETIINLPFYVDIVHPNRALPNIGLTEHEFVFEMDLVLPPKHAEYSLSEKQYNNSYRAFLRNLTITNVDDRNPFYSMTYKEGEKETVLINKII